MASSKLLPRVLRSRQFYFRSFVRRLSFSSPEAAATERRNRRRLLGMPPPSPLGDIPLPSLPGQPPVRKPLASPSIPKLPEPASSLSGPRLELHNNILTLIRSGDLHEACLLVRHSVYSNCRPTIFTVNAVLSALLGKSLHSDLVTLHRFVNQAGIAPTIATHNLLIQCYIDSCKLDVALSYYRFLCRDLPLLPSPSTYRILVKALLSAARIEEALNIKDEMVATIELDLEVYNLLMDGLVGSGDPDRALALFEEVREKLGDDPVVFGRIVYGSLMKAYFKKGMEREALDLYSYISALGEEDSQFRFSAQNCNSVLDALCKNGKFEEALALFERMMNRHCPPMRLYVDLKSFTLMVDGYCASGKFKEAINVFGKIATKKISADASYYNNLIKQLGQNGMMLEAEELYQEMSARGIKPNEHTFVFLMEACFGVGRIEDATRYLSEMADSGTEPGALAYNTVLCGLVKAEKLAEAKAFFDQMIEKEVKRDVMSYEVLLKAFCDLDRLDHVLAVLRALLMDDGVVFRPQMKELLEASARRVQMEVELGKLYKEVEKDKEDALAHQAEEKARLDALCREERLAKRAEAKAKQAATTKKTIEHIEMHIQRYSLNSAVERQQVSYNSSSSEVLKVGTENTAAKIDVGLLKGEEMKG